MPPYHHKSFQIHLLFSFLFLMKVYSSCSTATLQAGSRRQPWTVRWIPSMRLQRGWPGKQRRAEGEVRLCSCVMVLKRLPPSLFLYPHPWWVWDACQGAVPRFRDSPYHPLQYNCSSSPLFLEWANFMSFLPAIWEDESRKKSPKVPWEHLFWI